MKTIALLIGINYKGRSCRLNGCNEDVRRMKAFLEKRGFDDIHCLCDMSPDISEALPNKILIIQYLKHFLKEANQCNEECKFFIYFSGHGSYIKDLDGDEIDGKDEVIITYDLQCIVDDEIYAIIVNSLNSNVRCMFMFDCCHSGTMIDLERLKSPNVFGIIPNVVCISGCKDNQTSAELTINNESYGILTKTFIDTCENVKDSITFEEIISLISKNINTQNPVLSITNTNYRSLANYI